MFRGHSLCAQKSARWRSVMRGSESQDDLDDPHSFCQNKLDRLREQGQTVCSQYSHAVDVLGFCCCITIYMLMMKNGKISQILAGSSMWKGNMIWSFD